MSGMVKYMFYHNTMFHLMFRYLSKKKFILCASFDEKVYIISRITTKKILETQYFKLQKLFVRIT